jgi:putative membrane protein
MTVPAEHPHPENGSLPPDLAPRRTLLAAERTYLAWLRTSLGALGLALAVGRLLPAIVGASETEFALLGLGYGAFGLLILGLMTYRSHKVRAALRVDAPLPEHTWIPWLVSLVAAVLGAFTMLFVLVSL